MRPIINSWARLMARGLILTGFLLTGNLHGTEVTANELTAAWRLGARGLFAEASAAVSGTNPGEEADFTRAVLLFNRQPRTDADLIAAVRALSDLGANGSTAELRARSLYYAARAETLRLRDEPAMASAPGYERLWREYPEESYGQRALVHLLLLTFYQDQPPALVRAHCEEIIQQGGAITNQTVRSQFHQVAARGYLHLGGEDARALDHLLKAFDLGAARRETLGDIHVSIGQLAAEQGRDALAREHYEAFLREFPNDPRSYTIKAFLVALPE